MLTLPQTGIKELEKLAQTTSNCISLAQGALRIGGVPKEIKVYLQDVLNTDKADYYESAQLTALLQHKLAAHLKAKYNVTIPEHQIVITPGCIGGISIVLQTILSPGDEVILPEPTYAVYSNNVLLARSTPVFVSCTPQQSDAPWTLDIERLEAARTPKTKAVLFSNPCNPTGQILPLTELKKLLTWCEQHGIYLICDEVYEDYIFDGSTPHSIAELIPTSNYAIRASSFSKNFAMSGWRIGHLVLPKDLVEPYERAQHSLLICTSTLGQWAAVYALDHPELIQRFYDIVLTNMLLCKEMLKPLVDAQLLSYRTPQAGFYLFPHTTLPDTHEHIVNMARSIGVAVVPGEKFGPSGKQHFRICYARETALLREGLSRIVNYWSTHL